MLKVSRLGVTIFRNNIGTTQTNDYPPRTIKYGLCNPGGSDLIGFTSVEITPEMVGKKIAVFTAIECKSEKGKASESQKNFVKIVSEKGGISGIVKSPDEAEKMINEFLKPNK